MEFGVHLPLLNFDGRTYTLEHLLQYTVVAESLGYDALSVNDHLLFSRPWLDGPAALSAVLTKTGQMELATTVALPIIRGPVALAKALAAIDLFSKGRLIAGVGPGSSARDYAAVGIPFEERWKRLDESVQVLRALWSRNTQPFKGTFYDTEAINLEPEPYHPEGPPIWIGSWGSAAGLRRVVRLADGWLASGYNTTPQLFAEAWNNLRIQLKDAGKDADRFPNAIATMWLYVTEDRREADRILRDILVPTLKRPVDEVREKLPIGSAEDCAEKLSAYRDVGAQRVYVWPITDDISQITLFQERVAPLIGD